MSGRSLTLSIAGKGGTGKTSITAMLLRAMIEQGSFDEILVVDADPASNIPDILGVRSATTIGSVVDRQKESLDPSSDGECKLLRDDVFEAIEQNDTYDYVVMGRTTGKGCYCPINSLLRQMLDEVVRLYDLVLIDFDAGLEHFSRQTDPQSDVLLVVTDPSRMGFETARRIRELTDEVGNTYQQRWLIGCRFTPDLEDQFSAYAEMTGLRPLGVVPYDDQLLSLNLSGRNMFELDPGSLAYGAVENLRDRLLSNFHKSVA